MLAIFQELNSKGLYVSSKKQNENRCFEFTSSIKRQLRKFHVVVVQRRQRNIQKSVMHVQSCRFANELLFLALKFTSPSSLLKLPTNFCLLRACGGKKRHQVWFYIVEH